MALTLTVTRYRGVPPQRGISVRVEQQDCTIGRDPGHDLVLPDPDRFVSTNHAEIRYEAGTFHLTDTSTNGIFINHVPERVPRGHSVQLHDGDELTIGEYDLKVSITSGASTEAGHPADRGDHLRKPESRCQSDVPAVIRDETLDPWRREAGGTFPDPPPAPAGAGGASLLEPIPEGYDLLADLSEPNPFESPRYWDDFGAPGRREPNPRAGSSRSDHLPADREPYQPPLPETPPTPAPGVRRPAPATRQLREARERMFRRTLGYMSPVQAVQEAFEDIQAHELAVMAGLRAALAALLARLDPAELDRAATRGSVLDNLLPATRKARCWDVLTERYQDQAKTSSYFVTLT
jgi:type VI secretion system FHA domain protein